MKKYLILYLLILTSSTQLMAKNLYAELGITPLTIEPKVILEQESQQIVEPNKLKNSYNHSFSNLFKHVKTKKLSDEKSEVVAKVDYALSKRLKLELNLSTIVHLKEINHLNIKGEKLHFNFLIDL